MKKKIMVLCAIVLCISISAIGTLAYFTAEEKADNIITVGNVDIEIIEKTKNEDGELEDFPEEGIDGVVATDVISKIVSVENTGNNEAWIRVKVEQSIKDENGNELPLVLENGKSVMQIGFDTVKWIDGEDGFHYYTEPVPAGKITDTLFEEVTIAAEMDNTYAGCVMQIYVSAQAVQTANNPIPDGGDVTDIKGWPQGVSR